MLKYAEWSGTVAWCIGAVHRIIIFNLQLQKYAICVGIFDIRMYNKVSYAINIYDFTKGFNTLYHVIWSNFLRNFKNVSLNYHNKKNCSITFYVCLIFGYFYFFLISHKDIFEKWSGDCCILNHENYRSLQEKWIYVVDNVAVHICNMLKIQQKCARLKYNN